jgi:kynurenine formamidase
MFDTPHRFIDLTHLITPNIPSWDPLVFEQKNLIDYPQGCRTQSLRMNAGSGTHLDAPSHFVKGGWDVSDIPLDKLVVPLFVLNVSEKAGAHYKISPSDILNFEKEQGSISSGSFFLMYTGWSRFWPDQDLYSNKDENGVRRFPSLSLSAAELLLEREIVGIGIDTLSPDSDETFPVHHLLLNQNKYIVENLANCHLLPPKGAFIVLSPPNIKNATEATLRAFAALPK